MKLAKLLNKPEATRYFTPDNRFILPDCRIGLEFEFENTGVVARNRELPYTPWSHYWEWHEEGSIREGGSEFVFVEPLFGRDAITALEGLCAFAHENRWRSTLRTGLHVHMDVRDMEVMQLVGMCVLYAIFEPAIFHWIGDNRENSHFCVPWYRSDGSILEAADIIKSAVKPVEGVNMDLLQSAERYQRYAAFNLQALFRYGSVEARHMKTTTDVRRIMEWINLLMSMKRAVARIPASDTAIVRTVENLGPFRALEQILGPECRFLVYGDFDKDVLEIGIPTANELIREGLTINLWEQMNAPRGENEGFRRFMESHRRQFEEPPVRIEPQVAPELPPVAVIMDELADAARPALANDLFDAALQQQINRVVWGGLRPDAQVNVAPRAAPQPRRAPNPRPVRR